MLRARVPRKPPLTFHHLMAHMISEARTAQITQSFPSCPVLSFSSVDGGCKPLQQNAVEICCGKTLLGLIRGKGCQDSQELKGMVSAVILGMYVVSLHPKARNVSDRQVMIVLWEKQSQNNGLLQFHFIYVILQPFWKEKLSLLNKNQKI